MRLCRFGHGRLGVVENGAATSLDDDAGTDVGTDGDAGIRSNAGSNAESRAAGVATGRGLVTVRDVTAALDVLPACRYPLPQNDLLIEHLAAVRGRIAAMDDGPQATVALGGLSLLSPVANPGKLIGAPVNYAKHLEEVRSDAELHHHNQVAVIQRAGLFLKATSSLVGAGQGIALGALDRRNDHELELACVIGARATRVSRADALRHVAGYCIGLDITIRGPEERSLRKSPDSYSVLGPWLVTADEIADPAGLELRLTVNGAVRQASNTRHLILSVPELIAYASSFYTLHPGDVIFTGTPDGVGPILPGDVIVASIDRIGSMEVEVREATAADCPDQYQ